MTRNLLMMGLMGVLCGSAAHGVNVGYGLNYWMRNRLGLRVEGRGYGMAEGGFSEFRIGLTVR